MSTWKIKAANSENRILSHAALQQFEVFLLGRIVRFFCQRDVNAAKDLLSASKLLSKIVPKMDNLFLINRSKLAFQEVLFTNFAQGETLSDFAINLRENVTDFIKKAKDTAVEDWFQKSLKTSCTDLIAEVAIEVGFPFMLALLKNEKESSITELSKKDIVDNGMVKFLLFSTFRDLFKQVSKAPAWDFLDCKHTSPLKLSFHVYVLFAVTGHGQFYYTISSLYQAFEPVLPIWGRAAVERAELELSCGLDHQLPDRQQIARAFETGLIFWRDIDWPEEAAAVELATIMVGGFGYVVQDLVERFYEKLVKSKCFSEDKLVEMLNCYLEDHFGSFEKEINSSRFRVFAFKERSAFEEQLSAIRAERHVRALDLIGAFVEVHRPEITRLIQGTTGSLLYMFSVNNFYDFLSR